jgi:hypothetical protein
MIHRQTLGFWEKHIAYPLEQHVIQCLWEHYFPGCDNGIIINTTYNMEDTMPWAHRIMDQGHTEAVLFVSLVDPLAQDSYNDICQLQNKYPHTKVQLAGYCPFYFPNYDYVDFWALFMEKHFEHYTDAQLLPDHIENVFLSYNRKPHPHRIHLVEGLFGRLPDTIDVTDLGIVTLGDIDGSDHNNGVLTFEGNTTGIKHNQDLGDDRYGIQAAATALGNLHIWRNSFLSVVAETTANIECHIPFITEKTYKSILGLRPFIVCGDRGMSDYLHSHGYKTFESRLGFTGPFCPEQLNHTIQKLSTQDLDSLYQEWLPDLYHNRRNFYKHCATIRDKFGISLLDS